MNIDNDKSRVLADVVDVKEAIDTARPALHVVVATFWTAYFYVQLRGEGRRPKKITASGACLCVLIPTELGLDFSGFDGTAGALTGPTGNRVLRLWADDLLTVSNGFDWKLVIEAEEPFEREWLDQLVAPTGEPSSIPLRVFHEPPPAPLEVISARAADDIAPSAWMRVEDRRHPPRPRSPEFL